MDELDRERARLNKIRLKKLREKQPAVLRRKAEREKEREAKSTPFISVAISEQIRPRFIYE